MFVNHPIPHVNMVCVSVHDDSVKKDNNGMIHLRLEIKAVSVNYK